MRTLAAFLLATAIGRAQGGPPSLVDLGRLSIARVLASGANGPRDVTGAFAGESSSGWFSGDPSDWVMVRFARPVTIAGIAIEARGQEKFPPPDLFSVQIRPAGTSELFLSGFAELTYPLTVWAPPHPVEQAREVMILFRARSLFVVQQIQILGPLPANADPTPVTPPADPHNRPAPARAEPPGEAGSLDLVRALARTCISDMRSARLAVDRAPDNQHKAKAWMEVNRAADRLAELLRDRKGFPRLAKEASALGVVVEWCEPSGQWFARTQGYEQYLKLWPVGPDAEDAWWLGRLSNGPRCGDFEGTAEEYEGAIKDYSDYLNRFPNGAHASEVRQKLEDLQKEYKASPAKM